jgi:hypothetical protein
LSTQGKRVCWTAAAVALAGFGLLIYWEQTARPLWVDEEMLALNARNRSFARFADPLWLDQVVPLAWLALERLVMLTLGTGERAVRLLTVLFGGGTLMAALWIGRRWMGAVGATVLVLLCAIGEWFVFFTLELKHYSADTLGALFMPALAAWAIEGEDASGGLARRALLWWGAASAALWFSNGALFVTPACGTILCVEWARKDGRAARGILLAGLAWVVSSAGYYAIVLRHALANPFLRTYWAFAYPPTSSGVTVTLRWLAAQLEPFAVKPAGTRLWLLFWLAAASGILAAIAKRRPLGLMLAAVPLSALALALFHLVPPFERLVLWVVPSLYAGVALFADAAADAVRREYRRRRFLGLALALGGIAIAGAVCIDIAWRGALALANKPHSNYGLDDRRSVRWLVGTHHPGDVLMTTHFGLAAVWWYGGLNVSDPDHAGRLSDGTPIFEVGHVPPGPECVRSEHEIDAALSGQSRVLVYLGFRLNVLPPGFDTFVLESLARRAALVGYQRYVEDSQLAVFDLGQAPREEPSLPHELAGHPEEALPRVTGCLSVTPARRW